MNVDTQSFKRGAIRPMQCLREGWRLVKDDYWLFMGITVVGLILGSVAPMAILAGPAMCGIHFCLLRQERGQHVSFDMLFRGFDYFVQSLIATLIMVAIMILPMMLMILLTYALLFGGMFAMMAALPEQPKGAPPDPAVFLVPLAVVALMILVISFFMAIIRALFYFAYPLIVDRKLSGFDAVKLSARAALGNIGGMIGLTVLTELLGFIGVLACYFGFIFVLPIIFAIQSVAYQHVFHDEETLADVAEEFEEPAPAMPVAGPAETGIQGSQEG
jgi:uncharacterized membrane protein